MKCRNTSLLSGFGPSTNPFRAHQWLLSQHILSFYSKMHHWKIPIPEAAVANYPLILLEIGWKKCSSFSVTKGLFTCQLFSKYTLRIRKRNISKVHCQNKIRLIDTARWKKRSTEVHLLEVPSMYC